MNRSVFRWIAVVSVMSVGVSFGAAWAQSANPAQTPAQQNSNQVRRVDVTTLTPQQQLRVAARLVEDMSGKRRRVAQLLDTAQQQHDIIRVNCLNDKLTQIDVAIRSARDHMDLLQTAATISNDGQRNHEYSLMQIFGQRAETLDVEARQCVGEEGAGFGDRNELSVSTSVNIPAEDLDLFGGGLIEVYIPPTLSPIR